MPTVAELKAALDDLGVEYPRKARKAELEALLSPLNNPFSVEFTMTNAVAPVAGEVDVLVGSKAVLDNYAEPIEPWYWPDWAESRSRLPPGLKPRHVLKRGVDGRKPSGTPPHGKRWVTGPNMPEWLKDLQ